MRYITPTFAKFNVVGRLGKVPEVKETTRDGKTVRSLSFSLAVNRSYKGPDGKYIQSTSWIRFSVRDEGFIKNFSSGAAWQKGDIIVVNGNITVKESTVNGERTSQHYYNPYELYNITAEYRRKQSGKGGPTSQLDSHEADDFDSAVEAFSLGDIGAGIGADQPLPF